MSVSKGTQRTSTRLFVQPEYYGEEKISHFNQNVFCQHSHELASQICDLIANEAFDEIITNLVHWNGQTSNGTLVACLTSPPKLEKRPTLPEFCTKT